MEFLQRLSGGAPAAALILAAFVGFSLLALQRPALIERHLLRPCGLARRGDWATLVSSGFIHADHAHLFFNAFSFWAFGFGLERALGTPRFALLYALGLLAGSAVTCARHAREPGYASLGASAAILAVVFASIVKFPTASIFIMPLPVPIPAPLFALGYLAYSVYAGRARRGRVNHDAHLAGALTGLLFIAVAEPGALARAGRALAG